MAMTTTMMIWISVFLDCMCMLPSSVALASFLTAISAGVKAVSNFYSDLKAAAPQSSEMHIEKWQVWNRRFARRPRLRL